MYVTPVHALWQELSGQTLVLLITGFHNMKYDYNQPIGFSKGNARDKCHQISSSAEPITWKSLPYFFDYMTEFVPSKTIPEV